MNLIYCELFSLQSLIYASGSDRQEEPRGGPLAKRRKLNHPNSKANNAGSGKKGAAAAKQIDRVRDYVIKSLRGIVSQGSSTASSYPLGQSLTAQTYIALLPTIFWLLECRNDEEDSSPSSEVLMAVIEHAKKAGSLSGVKLPATEFVSRLILVSTVGCPSFLFLVLDDKYHFLFDRHDILRLFVGDKSSYRASQPIRVHSGWVDRYQMKYRRRYKIGFIIYQKSFGNSAIRIQLLPK